LLITATGFAEYTRIFFDVPSMWLIYVLLGFVLLVNVVGLRVVAQVQIVFFVGLVVSLLTFIVPGAAAIETANYTPFFPDYGGFGLAVVALFYPFLGFGLLIELGEEIDDPGRTIPLVLGLGIGIVVLFYVGLIAVLVGVVPYVELGNEADLALAASRFLPWWGEYVVAAGAIFAVVTTVNTTLLVFSRTLMRASRDGILPASLSRIHPRFDTPHYAVAVLGVPPFVLVPSRTKSSDSPCSSAWPVSRRTSSVPSASGTCRRSSRHTTPTPRFDSADTAGSSSRCWAGSRHRRVLAGHAPPATSRRHGPHRLVRRRVRLL